MSFPDHCLLYFFLFANQGTFAKQRTSHKHILAMNSALTPHLYSENGVYRGIHFLILTPKHRFWVLKILKHIYFFFFQMKIFTTETNICLMHGQVFVMLKINKNDQTQTETPKIDSGVNTISSNVK